ncbi:hypothetical protein [Aeromonas veronii]|uniref:hypothetical protein n=1 Tax=Aeromonas veronii TaxID=654 RepID=UPI001067FF72|nr:hypothetical protein [Aeromonas veronii]
MINVSRYKIEFYSFSLLFVFCASILNIKMFGQNLADGFYSQISYVSEHISSGGDLSPLFIIHTLRLIAVLPFYFSEKLQLPAYVDAILFIFYLWPIVSIIGAARIKSYLPFVFLFFPLFFSYRTVLGMCGMCYLYLILFYQRKSTILLLMSAMLANLSSGIIFGWSIAVIGSFKYFKSNYRFFTLFFLLICLGFVGSFIHKYEFMISPQGASVNGSVFERSTYYVSYINGQNSRLILYLFMAFSVFFIIYLQCLKDKTLNKFFFFFIGAIPLTLFEGIGLVSYLYCIILYLESCCRIDRTVTAKF